MADDDGVGNTGEDLCGVGGHSETIIISLIFKV